PKTTAQVQWTSEPFPVEDGSHQKTLTADISSIIQEIIDQDGWAAGNAMVLVLRQDPATPSIGHRECESFNGAGGNIDQIPTLIIQFGDVALDDVWREAEYPDTMGANWAVATDAAASGLKYLTDNGEGSNTGSATPEWVNTYNFEAAGGDYKILARVIAPNGSDDSLWVRIPTATAQTAEHPDQAGTGWVRYNSIAGGEAWHWDEVHSNDHDNATVIWTLPAGQNVLEIAIREDGTKLDGFVITNDLGLDENTMPDKINPPPIALGPIPEDGAIDADVTALEWTAPDVAVSNKVYLSLDETIDESDLAAETDLSIHLAALDPGTTYYWRVDAVEADGTVNEGSVWSFSTLPLEAHFPSPADGAIDVAIDVQLSWTAGKDTIMHNVNFGTDPAMLLPVSMMQMGTTYDPGILDPFGVYYWSVDEFTPLGTVAGPVWSFSIVEYLVISDDEVTVNYDNTAEPFVSEVALDTPADLRFGGVADLTMRFQGGAASGVSFDEATGTYTITGAGDDIWNNADAFHYVYRELTGDATMVARVTDNGTGSNAWAKGGVMIRQSLEPGSVNVSGFITGGSGDGGTFQWRDTADASSDSSRTLTGIAPPYWVRIVRAGNTFTVDMSADGVDWVQEGDSPMTIEMTDPVLIGLAVTSHQTGELRTFTFDNVDIVGDISAESMSTDVGTATSGNAPAPIYVALEDSTGATAMVTHGNPAATSIESWRQWTISLDEFEGVDASSAAKLYIGVGDGTLGGTGTIRVDDIRVVKPSGAVGPSDVTVPGDIVKGVPDDGDWPGAETPDLAIDDNTATKYLHFKGETEPTGIKVTPLDGPSVVTGLSFTTANDAAERDPVSFELSGSNDSIDGPFTLIASGDIVDFAQEAAWPRFTKNETAISFDNDVAYAHYQVMFPAVRDAASANSMQIAEVELLSGGATSLLSVVRSNGVSGDRDPVGPYDGSSAPLATEPGGLMDGNLVFSDRTYPWAGVPAEYVGSEYIRTYNSDKNGGTTDVTYEVTISRPAIVWVTIDDRIPAEWDAGGAITSPQDAADYVTAAFAAPGTFADTGIDLFVREASDGSNDRPMSVYAAELDAGTYVFGSMDSGKNFYSIGAIE
ncbi:MAG: DUF1349 domain-containing protein, partial [Planctomycetota bacterium]